MQGRVLLLIQIFFLKFSCMGQVLSFIPALILEGFKTLCAFGISSTQNQVSLSSQVRLHPSAAPGLQKSKFMDYIGGGGRKLHRNCPSTPLIYNQVLYSLGMDFLDSVTSTTALLC